LEEWKQRFIAIGAEVDATPWKESAMAETMLRLKPAYVFALLGTTRARMNQVAATGGDRRTQSYEAVDYGLTAMLARAAIAAKIQPRFVYLSALTTKGANVSPYYKARIKAEEAVMSSGLPYTIARPSFISGPDRDDKRPGERIGAAIADTLLAVVGIFDSGKMKARYGSITNTALAEALVRLAFDNNAINKIFESNKLRTIMK
jgi:uncharacterized protein YbjT (DUF2867 family)